jgi:hypothetical protein
MRQIMKLGFVNLKSLQITDTLVTSPQIFKYFQTFGEK